MTPPILGIWASQISGHLWAPAGAYDALATVTVPATAVASVTFSGIPSGYKHLQIRGINRCDGATGVRDAIVRFNGDSGSNYSRHWMYTFDGGGSVNALANASQTNYGYGYSSGTTSGGNVYSGLIMDILDYSSTTKNKTVRTLVANEKDSAGTSSLLFSSGGYFQTTPITSITFSLSSDNFVQYSQFALYGVK